MASSTRLGALAVALLAVAACSEMPTSPEATKNTVKPPRSFAVTAESYDGNATCQTFGYHGELKLDGPYNYNNQGGSIWDADLTDHADGVADGYLTATTSGVPGMAAIYWSTNHPVDLVLVKFGNGGIKYTYNPEASSGGPISTDLNPTGNNLQAVSHIDFCYDIELDVKKTAATTYTRTWTWDIAKSATGGPFTFSGGQTDGGVVSYTVAVTRNASTDSNWGVSGTITIKNPTNFTINLSGVSDALVGDNVTCTGGTSQDIPGGGQVDCTYSGSLSSGASTTNVATASSGTPLIGVGSGSADVTFGDPTTKVDECAAVGDDKKGSLAASLCASQTFNYTIDIASAVSSSCVDGSYVNTATVDPATSHLTESAQASASYTMNCGNPNDCNPALDPTCNPEGDPGCTLSYGYWKTHSIFGPASKPDDTWALVGGPTTPWYSSGVTWLVMFNTAVKGNVYWDLAHQYGGALLNQKNGASVAVVAADMAAAETFFTTKSPSYKPTAAEKTALTALAARLANFNVGLATGGPPHCSELSGS